MTATVIHGDAIAEMRRLAEEGVRVQCVVTDPPYGLSDHRPEDVVDCLRAWINGEEYRPNKKGFMGRVWDAWVPGPEVWRAAYDLLPPGGHLVVFAGTRSMDLMSMAIRLAGFELRDSIGYAHDAGGAPLLAWCHGQGFPKGTDISKALDRMAGAAREVVGQHPYAARKPNGTWTGEVYGEEPSHASGPTLTAPATDAAKEWAGWNTQLKPAWEPIILARKPLGGFSEKVRLTASVLATWEAKRCARA